MNNWSVHQIGKDAGDILRGVNERLCDGPLLNNFFY